MPGELNNATVTQAGTGQLAAPRSARLRIHVSSTPAGSTSVQYRLGYGGYSGRVDFETPLSAWRTIPPGSYSFDESQAPFDGIEIRSTSSLPASVSLDCVPT